MKYLVSYQQELFKDWANSSFVGDTADETIQRNAHALGQVDLINKLTEVTYEEITEVNSDNK